MPCHSYVKAVMSNSNESSVKKSTCVKRKKTLHNFLDKENSEKKYLQIFTLSEWDFFLTLESNKILAKIKY